MSMSPTSQPRRSERPSRLPNNERDTHMSTSNQPGTACLRSHRLFPVAMHRFPDAPNTRIVWFRRWSDAVAINWHQLAQHESLMADAEKSVRQTAVTNARLRKRVLMGRWG